MPTIDTQARYHNAFINTISEGTKTRKQYFWMPVKGRGPCLITVRLPWNKSKMPVGWLPTYDDLIAEGAQGF